MKRLIVVAALAGAFLLPAPAHAYDHLWKDVEAACQADKPKTALTAVDRIYTRALSDGNAGQCLKALVTRYRLVTSLSPDSTAGAIALLSRALDREKDETAQALYHVVIGRLELEKVRPYALGDAADSTRSRAAAHFEAALARPEGLAAARATDYVPLIEPGSDSRYYNDDALSVVGRCILEGCRTQPTDNTMRQLHRRVSHTLLRTYRQRDNRAAIVLTAIDSLRGEDASIRSTGKVEEQPFYSYLTSLIQQYPDEPTTPEAYIELCERLVQQNADSLAYVRAEEGIARFPKQKRTAVLQNIVASLTQPQFNFQMPETCYPGTPYTIKWRVRNVEEVRLYCYRLPVTAKEASTLSANDKQVMKKAHPAFHVDTTIVVPNPYETLHFEQSIRFSEPGVYLLQAVSGKNKSLCRFLYVSRVAYMCQSLAGPNYKVALVDAQSGKPLPGAVLSACVREGKQVRQVASYTADGDGIVRFSPESKAGFNYYFAQWGDDAYSPDFSSPSYPVNPPRSDAAIRTRIHLYTDRGVYRPGQEIRFGGIAYRQHGDSTEVMPNRRYDVALWSSNGKKIDTLSLHTDSLGTLSGVFRLPTTCLNGGYAVRCNDGGVASVRVEAYKRPTYSVTLTHPDYNFVLGDTLLIGGEARLYSGVALKDATVTYTIERSAPYRGRQQEPFFNGEAEVDSAGRFTLSVPLILPFDFNALYGSGGPLTTFIVKATVAGSDGENEEARLELRAQSRYPRPQLVWPAMIERSSSPLLRIKSVNAAGRTCSGEGEYRITDASGREVLTRRYKANERIDAGAILALPSGSYRVEVVPDGPAAKVQTSRHEFVVFSESDPRPASNEPLWFYAAENTARFGDTPIRISCGTPEHDAYLYYDLYSNDRLIESKCYHLSDTVLHFSYTYQPSYGDGVTAVFGLYRNGKLHATTYRISKAEPDKRLRLQWTTFRDRLRPGQQEEWRMKVTKPDGTPVSASLIATLYDASLTKFAETDWRFALRFGRSLPFVSWSSQTRSPIYAAGSQPYKGLLVSPLRFNEINLLSVSNLNESLKVMPLAGTTLRSTSVQNKRAAAGDLSNDAAALQEIVTVEDAMAVEEKASGAAAEEEESEEFAFSPRENFNETAFFHPQLRTDGNGEVRIAFTLPESLTSWNFKALAHTARLDYGQLDTTIVATKDFMVQGNMPRFLRSGDETALAFNLRNLTAQPISGRVRCELLDAESEKTLWSGRRSFEVAANGLQVVTFDVEVDDAHSLLICRVMAEGKNFSDGEQSYLPILPDGVELTESLPLALDSAGTHTIDLKALYNKGKKAEDRKLTIEYMARPMWAVVQSLPALAQTGREDALTLTSAYYAATLAGKLLDRSPQLRQLAATWHNAANEMPTESPLERNADLKQLMIDETPWLVQAESERARTHLLADYYNTDAVAYHTRTYLEKLAALQKSDGAWSWFPGMPGSEEMTLHVAEMLVRLRLLTQKSDADALLEKALGFLNDCADKRVNDMREMEEKGTKPVVNGWLLRYLWISTHAALKPAADKQTMGYLLRLLGKQQTEGSMYDKALASQVLHQAGNSRAAQERLQSLLEYTVTSPAMGRYFDTKRAQLAGDSYRIPTQVAAIEALRTVVPEDRKTRNEMLKWLVQAKRTQDWGNVRNSIDAVYALAAEEAFETALAPATEGQGTTFTVVSAKGKTLRLDADAANGYFRTTLTEADMREPSTLILQKRDSLPAWGGIYATYVTPADEATAAASGLKVECRYLYERNGRREHLTEGTMLMPGDKVSALYTLTADRDYDYVCLKAPRPACLEPVNPLSGYDASIGWGAYRDVKDAATHYFIEKFPKGSLTLTVESRVDRRGTFRNAPATLQSVYAPEFLGHTTGIKLKVN